MNSNQTDKASFTLLREFDAPKELVFNAFSTPDALNEWWGPAESKNTVISLDFRRGGIFHYKMYFNEDLVTYGLFKFGEINPYDLIEFTSSFANEKGEIIRAPFGINIPLEIFNRITLTEKNGKTTISLTAEPVNAAPDEIEVFRSLQDSMKEGNRKMYDKLDEYLNKGNKQ